MQGSGVSVGQPVASISGGTSKVLEVLRCLGTPAAGCDIAVEEQGRGGAWCGDVLPLWRRESEETVSPFGLL